MLISLPIFLFDSSKIEKWEGNLATHLNLASGALPAISSSSHLTLAAGHNSLPSVNGAKLPIRSQSPNLDDRSHTPMIADLLNRGNSSIIRCIFDSICIWGMYQCFNGSSNGKLLCFKYFYSYILCMYKNVKVSTAEG